MLISNRLVHTESSCFWISEMEVGIIDWGWQSSGITGVCMY